MYSLQQPDDQIALRLFVAVVGGYIGASGLAAGTALAFTALRLPPAEAAQSAALVGLVAYVAAGLWALIARSVAAMAAVSFLDGGALLVLAICLK